MERLPNPGAALWLGLAANAVLLAFIALDPPSSQWSPPVLLVSIAALGLVGCFNSVKVQPNSFLDAEFVAALLALVFLGPLPAMCVWLAGEATYVLLLRQRAPAHLANVASYGWAALAGARVLETLAPNGVAHGAGLVDWGAVALAGATMLFVNFVITRGIVAVVADGRSLTGTFRRELIRPAPAAFLMIASGTVTAFLYVQIGIPALVLFSATVFLPRLAATLLQKDRTGWELDHSEALPLYADRIARALRLGYAERLVVRDAASYIRVDRTEAPRGKLSDLSNDHRHALVEALLYKGEHWDGRGGRPGAVGGEMIPLSSRILAVADAWARMTADTYPRLSHTQALDRIEDRAGVHFDPKVVEAVARVVDSRSFS
jgi:hypothetical protein